MIPAPPDGLDARGRAAWALLFGPPIAHRGLWTPGGAPENSLAAFEAACAAGYGIELDVRLSTDGEAVVFHDSGLERMTGEAGRVAERTAAALADLRLLGTDQPIPTLAETLALVAGRALLLIELKTRPGEDGPLEAHVAALLDAYEGPAAVIGFNAASLSALADLAPGLLLGLDSYGWNDAAAAALPRAARAGMADFGHLPASRAHFVGPGLDIVERPGVAALRARGVPAVAWTVRSPEQAAHVRPLVDNLIFEGFAP